MVSADAKRSRYVDGNAGWRFFFFSVVMGAILGLSFRLYFNPSKIKGWVETALAEQRAPADIRFQAASLRLANGALPFFAVEMRGVEVSLTTECRFEPGLKIERLWIPLSFSSLFTGRLAIGTIEGDGVVADIDTLKSRCGDAVATEEKTGAERKGGAKDTPSSSPETAAVNSSPAVAWWTSEQMAEIRSAVAGLRLSNVEVLFEEGTKKVYLSSLLISPDAEGEVRLESDLIVPPELIFGERLPPLRIEADARPDMAKVRIRAHFNEGEFLAEGRLAPAADGHLDAQITASLKNVPLSVLAPVALRSGIVNGTFQPRFMWMNCRAEVRGNFQGLLDYNPLHLENCEIAGGGGSNILLAKATRYPNGSWDPIRFEIKKIELRRIMETFGWQGPESIFSDYGRLSGTMEIPLKGKGRFEGFIEDAVIRFSSRKQLAFQNLKSMRADIRFKNDRLDGTLEGFEFVGGALDGQLEFTLTNNFKNGHARARIRNMRLSENVQSLLFSGHLENAYGDAEATFQAGRLTDLKSLIHLRNLSGKDIAFEEASARTEFESASDGFRMSLAVPEFRVAKRSPLFGSTRALFFEHEFSGDWVSVRDLVLRAKFLKSGGLSWDSLQGSLEQGLIHIESAGRFTRDRTLTGWVSLDYPLVKKLRWKLSGQLPMPVLTDDSETLTKLKRASSVTNKALGLPDYQEDEDKIIEKNTL